MFNDEINKLIERFRDAKNGKGLTDNQLSEISGLPSSWIEELFDGKIMHPRFYPMIRMADVLEVSLAEVDKILHTNQHECCIGVYWNYDDSDLMTREDFEDLVKREEYTREQYCDKEFLTNLEKFDFCPKCGKKIDWDAIRENR